MQSKNISLVLASAALGMLFGFFICASGKGKQPVPLFNNKLAEEENSSPTIIFPGPDTANFPTSPFTLPKGWRYFENFPLYLYTSGCGVPRTYYWSYLLRIGIIEHLELRFAGQGLTHISCNKAKGVTGFSPLAVGLKAHLIGEPEWLWWPNIGIDLFCVMPLASEQLLQGTQYIINGLFDHRFSYGLSLEWNIGAYSRPTTPTDNHPQFYLLANWSLQKEITSALALFFEGYYSSASKPCYPRAIFLGIGFLYNVTQRVSMYGSVNGSLLHTTNPALINFGFAVAF